MAPKSGFGAALGGTRIRNWCLPCAPEYVFGHAGEGHAGKGHAGEGHAGEGLLGGAYGGEAFFAQAAGERFGFRGQRRQAADGPGQQQVRETRVPD